MLLVSSIYAKRLCIAFWPYQLNELHEPFVQNCGWNVLIPNGLISRMSFIVSIKPQVQSIRQESGKYYSPENSKIRRAVCPYASSAETIRHLLRFGPEPMACDGFKVTVFISLHFSPVHTRNEAFANVSAFESLCFHHPFSVDERRKRIKKYAFSNENALA